VNAHEAACQKYYEAAVPHAKGTALESMAQTCALITPNGWLACTQNKSKDIVLARPKALRMGGKDVFKVLYEDEWLLAVNKPCYVESTAGIVQGKPTRLDKVSGLLIDSIDSLDPGEWAINRLNRLVRSR
jgi:23S rRNA-/tRNA-specific pseudouridylate synthase